MNLPAGAHTLTLVYSVIDDTYGAVQVTTTSGINVNIIAGQSTPANFSAATLTYNDDDDGDGITNLDELNARTDPMNAPPTVVITFPPPVSMTEGESVTVYGTANDNDIIDFVRVNGVVANTSDGYATWSATVPLALNNNVLLVETGDVAGNSSSQSAEIAIVRNTRLVSPQAIALDAANERVLVVDSILAAVITVDLITGMRTVLSDATTPNANNPFSGPVGITLDTANGRALVLDSTRNAVFVVNLITGARAVLSDAITPDANNLFSSLSGIVLDTANNRA